MKTRLALNTVATVLGLCITTPAIFAQAGGDTREMRANAEPAAATSVPRLVQFNGTLKDSAARPVAGVSSVTFAIYTEQDGGSALWSETENVLADANGHFAALLGTATSGGFPSELFSTPTPQMRWLGITIARQAEMPRVLLASVPYAMKAGDADTLGGLPASSYVTTSQLAARGVIAAPATTIVASPMVAGSGSGGVGAPNANGAGVASADAAAQSVTQATITGTGTANYLPLWTSGTNLGVSKIYQANGGFIGINTNTPLLQLDVNGNSIFRGSFQMAPQGTATAGAGQPSHSFQWQASLFNSSTNQPVNEAFGFRTVPDQNDTANPTAKLDLFYGPGGGTLNDTGLSINHSGVITFAPNQTFSGSSLAVNSITLPLTPNSGTGIISIGGHPFLSTGNNTNNIFLGGDSGGDSPLETGIYDTAVGFESMLNNTSGIENTAVGAFAMLRNTTGQRNTVVGLFAANQQTTGSDNTAIGDSALQNLTTGIQNTAIGDNAGYQNITGNNNTFLGTGTTAAIDGLFNSTAVGANAVIGESNALVLGATGTNVGIGTNVPANLLNVVDPGASYTTPNLALFESNQANRNVVYATNTATSGGGAAGYFTSNGPTGYGIVALNQNAGAYAGYFFGNVHVAGTLSKSAGSFKIDDPIDPAGKYLSHSFVESPDMKNIYDGTVTTDGKGYATVSMPAWFEALNRDFRYQLTTINSFSRATIAVELKDGKFRIRTTQPHVKVSWQVTGIRHDAYAEAHRIPTEEDKVGDEQGKYLYPELFGAGSDKAIGPVVKPGVEAKTDATTVRTATTDATGRE